MAVNVVAEISKFEAKVQDFMLAEGMVLETGGRAVAVSGGADSTALIRLVHRLANPAEARLQIFHVNYGLRGVASDRDEKFVRLLGSELNLGVSVLRVRSRPKANVQDWARKLRYRWFARLQKSMGLAWVATGHTADDQAETLLERLGRGSGPMGLSSIRPSAVLYGVSCIRPFLLIPREEIIRYLRSLGQGFRKDASNQSNKYARNRIRKILAKMDPLGKEGLSRRLAQSALLTGEMMELLENFVLASFGRGEQGLLVRELVQKPQALSRWALRLLALQAGVSESSLGFEKIESGLALAMGPSRGRSRLTLGKSHSFARHHGMIRVVSNPPVRKRKSKA